MSEAKGADGGGGGNNIVWFLYMGQDRSEIPRDITHARVDPSVNVIGEKSFDNCKQLVEVEFCEGLEEIGFRAFSYCTSLTKFKVPSTVKKIGAEAFCNCEQLVEVELCELEQIGQ